MIDSTVKYVSALITVHGVRVMPYSLTWGESCQIVSWRVDSEGLADTREDADKALERAGFMRTTPWTYTPIKSDGLRCSIVSVVRHRVTFTSADDAVSTCEVPCAFDAYPHETVRRVHDEYGHLALHTDNGGVFYTISGVDCPTGGMRVHVDAYGVVRVP